MDTFRTIQPMINDIHKLRSLENIKTTSYQNKNIFDDESYTQNIINSKDLLLFNEIEEKSPNILTIDIIKYYHNNINNIDNDIKKRFNIYYTFCLATPDLYNHCKSVEKDYRNTIFNTQYYRHFLRLTSLENIGKLLSDNDYNYLNKYITNIKSTYLQLLDPNNLYIDSPIVNKHLNSCLSLCDQSLKEVFIHNLKLQSYIINNNIQNLDHLSLDNNKKLGG